MQEAQHQRLCICEHSTLVTHRFLRRFATTVVKILSRPSRAVRGINCGSEKSRIPPKRTCAARFADLCCGVNGDISLWVVY